MKPIILAFALGLLFFCGCTLSQKKKDNKEPRVNFSKIAIIPYDSTTVYAFRNSKPYKLTQQDLFNIEKILTQCLTFYNSNQEREYEKIKKLYPGNPPDKKHFLINLANYKRQYIAVINPAGEKEVWINCFCNDMSINWKKEIVFVLDGGNCFFNLKINLSKGQYYDLWVNGDA